MKLIRLFLIRNLTTALFMAAYYRQERLGEQAFRDICLLHGDDEFFLKPCSGDGKARRNREVYEFIASRISSEIYAYPESAVDYSAINFFGLGKAKTIKQARLWGIQSFLELHDIRPELIREVHHGNRMLHQYLKYLNPNIKLVGFEHGLSDIRNHLEFYTPLRKARNFLKTKVGRAVSLFNPYSENDALRVSLFSNIISGINRRAPLVQLKPEFANEFSAEFARNYIKSRASFSGKKIAVILLNNINRMSRSLEGHLVYYKELAEYLRCVINKFSQSADCVLVVPREADQYFEESKACFRNQFNGREVCFFDEICEIDCPIEYFLNAINPETMFANTSSGLFYSKALQPEIKTFTFHPFVMGYLRRNFGKIFPDYKWVLNLFYKKYREEFQDVLPEVIPATFSAL